MPYCENCGSLLSSEAKFCSNCGTASPTQAPKETKHASKKVISKPAAPNKERLDYYSPPAGRVIPSAPLPIFSSTKNQQAHSQPPNYQAPPQTIQPPPQIVQPSPQLQPVAASSPTPQQQQVGGETTVGVIPFRRMKSLGRYDSFAGVVTTERLIFAQLTADMINAAATQARNQAKADGKGFFGQWADQLKGTFGFTNKYLNMTPQAILSETAGNWELQNSTITEIKIHQKGQHDEYNNRHEFEAEIKSSQGTFKFRMDENTQYIETFKRVFGERVKMPFGYFGKSINIGF